MSDAVYSIAIDAEMTGAETAAELDALADKLQGAGKNSEDFQRTIKRLSSDLEAVKAASAEAAAALAAGNDQYKILERDAIRAGKAVEKAQASGRFDPRAARAAYEAQTALDAYTGTLKGLERASAAASAKQDSVANSLAKVSKLGAHADARAALLNQRYEKLQALVGRLPGPLGRIGSELVGSAKAAQGASHAFGGVNIATIALAAGAVIAVTAVVALSVALVAGAIAATAYAVSQADAAREMYITRSAFAKLSEGAEIAVDSFNSISDATGIGEDALISLSKKLIATKKVMADEMPEALLAASLAEQALGKGGSDDFVERLKDGTLTVAKFSTDMAKFEGDVAARLRGIGQQSAKFDRQWTRIFGELNIDPFLDALGVLVSMFEKGNPLAEAFGSTLKGVFDPIGPMALKAAYAIEAFALGFAIQLTKMYIAVKPALKWLGEFFGFDAGGSALLDTLGKAGEIAAVLAVVLGGALLVAVGAVGAVIAVAAAAVIGFGLAIYNAVSTAWSFFSALIELGAAIVGWATTVGVDLMNGLIAGITATVSAVVAAVSGAVTQAIDAAKSVLGIASPSKVFAEIGDFTVAGFTGAIDEGAADARNSMANMVDPQAAVAGGATDAPAPGARGGAGSGRSTNLTGVTFNFYGIKDAEGAIERLREAFTQILEDDAASFGGAPA